MAEWRQFAGPLKSPLVRQLREQLLTLKTSLKTVERLFKRIEDGIKSVETVMSIIRRLEVLLQKGIYAILDAIIAQVREFLNNLSRSGIYFLDLTSYHFDIDFPSIVADKKIPTIWFDQPAATEISTNADGAIIEKLNEYVNLIESKGGINDNDVAFKEFKEAVNNLHDALNGKNENQFVDGQITYETVYKLYKAFRASTGNKKGILDDIGFLFDILKYKKETYVEFIDVICNALMDPNDRPERSLMTLVRQEMLSQPPQNNVSISNFTNSVFRSGAPAFYGDSAKVNVIIVALSIGNFQEFFEALRAIWQFKKHKEHANTLLNELNKIDLTYTAGRPGFVADIYGNDKETGGDFLDRVSSFLSRDWADASKLASKSRGEEPNFYSITLNSLFYELFQSIENILRFLESFKLSDELYSDSIFKPIKKWIIATKKTIAALRTVLQYIEDLINMIEALLAMTQLTVLTIESDQGIYDVVKQIKEAKGFATTNVSRKEIMKKFGIENNIDAKLFIENEFNYKTTGKKDKEAAGEVLLEAIQTYKGNLEVEIQQAFIEYNEKKAVFDLLIIERNNMQIVHNEVIVFESELQNTNYATLKTQLESLITSFQSTISSLNQLYDDALIAEGNRQWLNEQITLFTEELIDVPDANVSPFNQANYEAQQSTQQQVDDLDTQHADPSAPSVPNYASTRAALVETLEILEEQKSEHDATYTALLNRYQAIEVLVDNFLNSFVVDEYTDLTIIQDKIDDIEDEIESLKIAFDSEVASYDLQISNKEAEITDKQNQINAKYNTISANLNSIAQLQAEIAYLQLRIDEDPTNPLVPTWEAQIDAKELEITALEGDNTTLYADIATLQSDIDTLQDEIETLEEEKQEYINDQVANQEDLFIEKTVYEKWIVSETKRLDVVMEQNTFNSEYITQKNALKNMVNTLINQKIPSFNLSQYNSIITKLQTEEQLKIFYDIDYVIYNSNVVFDEYIPNSQRTNNALIKTDLENEEENANVETAKSKYETLVNYLGRMPNDDSMGKKMNEARDLISTDAFFDPVNDQLYFAGFLLCWGYADDTVLNVSKIYEAQKTEFESESEGDLKTLEKELGNWDTAFKKLLKSIGLKD